MQVNDSSVGRPNYKLSPSFTWLNTAQFLGAMNDNILKLLIIFFLINARGAEAAGVITALVGAAFALPFLIFSAPAGCLADRLAKSRMIVTVKMVEVVVTLLAVIFFALGWQGGLYLIVFLMATHSAFFAPAKYGVVPELTTLDQLSRANGLLESFCYLAIIIGTGLASMLTQATGERFWVAGLVCVGLALAGLWAASHLEPTMAADAERKVFFFPTEILRTVMTIHQDRNLMLAIIGLAWFMFVGAFAQLNLIGYGM
jgi:acyl-[acyl-carrier-protein]-phospholipid O-acyltransferase/long-chain-fatty-acid--[acyl-carrier-protein] ligase